MIKIYAEHITTRLAYIFEFIFEDVLGVKYSFVSDRTEFDRYSGPKFSYGNDLERSSFHFEAHPILFEKGVRQQEISIKEWEGLPVFFHIEDASALPFDPFAMAFYLVTRYEEYLPFDADEHGRFTASSSLAFREGFLNIPLVDILAHRVAVIIGARYPEFEIPDHPLRFIPTFDIDIAYAHLGKGWKRATLAWLKLILTLRFGVIKERLLTVIGTRQDPYDNFRFQEDLTTMFGYKPIYFTLLGDLSRYDRNISHRNPRFRRLLNYLSRHSEMGLHPSYQSYLDAAMILNEKERLEKITGNPVSRSRFHFLRFKFPESFRILLDSGISDDYSIGYSNLNGFRASTSVPFDFFDLLKDEKRGLKLHPFLFMDTACIDHLGLTPEEGVARVEDLLATARKYGGEAVGIWHNYALSEKYQYKGWRKFLEEILENNNKQSL